jgi:hypothetical protein
MAIPALLGGAARVIGGQMVKSGGKAAAGKILNRKDNKKNKSSIVKKDGEQQKQEGKKSGALAIRPKTTLIPASVVKASDTKTTSVGSDGILVTIYKKVVEIDKLLKGTLAEEKALANVETKKRQKSIRDEKEGKLEKKKTKEEKKSEKLSLPKIGFFDRIKKFITSIITGFILQKLVDFGPEKLEGIILAINSGLDVAVDLIIGIVDAAGTFLKWGQDAYDATKGWLGDTFGEGAASTFEGFMSNLNKAFNLIGIIALGVAAIDPFDMFGDKKNKKPKLDKKGRDVNKRKQIKKDFDKIKKENPNLSKKDALARAERQNRDVKKRDKVKKEFDKIRKDNPKISRPDALKQATQAVDAPKPKGFFGRLVSGAKSAVKSAVRNTGKGLNYLSGGQLGKFGNVLQNQYKNASTFAKNQYDRVTSTASRLKGKFDGGMKSIQNKLGSLAEGAKKLVLQKIIDPLMPFIEPIIKRVKGIGDKLFKTLSRIPGFDSIAKVFKKFGGMGSKQLGKKIGPKLLPVIGGIFNLLFAYDRLADGDSTGALIETVSAGLDLLPLMIGPAGATGPHFSMALDAYMFARDFVPAIQEKETEIINGMGLGGLKGMLDTAGAKLPNLGEILGKITGGDTSTQSTGAGTTPVVAGSDETGLADGAGANVTGASGKGMKTGPAGYDRIGAGAAYHVDTKFHQSMGINGMISAMDKMADAYTARNKEIVFSGQGYARSKSYKSDLDPAEKKKLMQSAIDAHSHSSFMRAEGFKPFDYYIPDISANKDLYHSSTEGAEILLPEMGGETRVGSAYGGYGKSAEIFDTSGKLVALTGHGDLHYSKGGFTKSGAHKITVGENGREFVLDADSTAAIERVFPGLLSAANKAKGEAAINALKNYASYEQGGESTVVINQNQLPVSAVQQEQSSSAPVFIPMGSGVSQTDILYAT